MRRAAENLPHQGLEKLQRLDRIVRIERHLVPTGTERLASGIPRMPLQPIARIPVAPQVMSVVVRLHQPVLLDDPRHLRTHVGPENARCHFRVIVRSQLVTNVVNQGSNQQLLIGAVGMSSRRRLQ